MSCPACSAKTTRPVEGLPVSVSQCNGCGAIYGSCYKGDSYRVYKPFWHEGECAPEDMQYVDLETVGSAGVERFHGWIHRGTRRIVQTG